MRTSLAAAAASVLAALAVAAPASADSIAYLRDHNVWIANPDGSGQYQVTTNGTAGLPYIAVSQADDGTIAAAQYNYVYLLRQNGSVIRQLDPPALTNSYSHTLDGKVIQTAISPDGSKIAYTFNSFEVEGGGSNLSRPATGYIDANGSRQPGNLYNAFPSWVTNTRSLTSGGFGSHVNIHDQGQEQDVNWLNDNETDLGDPEVNRQGTRLAAVRGYGPTTKIVTYETVGDVLTGTPERTANARCEMGPLEGLSSPSWAPDGNALVWTEPDGLWTMDQAGTCVGQPRLLIPGATQPDWGPAPVNPGPREDVRRDPPPPPDPPRDTPRRDPPGRPAKPSVTAPKTFAQLSARGVRIRATCAAACTVKPTLVADKATARKLRLPRNRVLAKGTKRLSAAGTATVTLKPSAKLRKKLAKLRKATLTLRVAVAPAGGKATTFQQTLRVKR